MNRQYRLFTDATIDLSEEIVRELDITVIPMNFTISDDEYRHYSDERELSLEDFYKRIKAGEMAKTTQINYTVYEEYFTPVLERGEDILYISFSSGLSGTFQASVLAAEELSAKYTNSKVISVDSLCASNGEGLLTILASRKRKEGYSIDELADWIRENRLNVCHWYTVDDLNHLRRGGRIGAVSAAFGTTLNIKPIMNMDYDGRLQVVEKVRGRKKSLDTLVDHMQQSIIPCDRPDIVITHADCIEDAQYIKNKILLNIQDANIYMTKMGPVIGAHTGAGCVLVSYMGSDRKK